MARIGIACAHLVNIRLGCKDVFANSSAVYVIEPFQICPYRHIGQMLVLEFHHQGQGYEGNGDNVLDNDEHL